MDWRIFISTEDPYYTFFLLFAEIFYFSEDVFALEFGRVSTNLEPMLKNLDQVCCYFVFNELNTEFVTQLNRNLSGKCTQKIRQECDCTCRSHANNCLIFQICT